MKTAVRVVVTIVFVLGMVTGLIETGYAVEVTSAFGNKDAGFSLDAQVMTYEKGNGEGGSCSGTVTSKPGKINCDGSEGSVCAATLPSYSTVTLKAIPDEGCVFSGWYILQDADTGVYQDMSKYTDRCEGANPCSLTLGGRSSDGKAIPYVTALFEKEGNLKELKVFVDVPSASEIFSIISKPVGIICNRNSATPSDTNESGQFHCAALFNVGSSVTLTVKDGKGKFLGWGDDGAPAGPPRKCYGGHDTCKIVITRGDVDTVVLSNQGNQTSHEDPASAE